MAPGSDRGLSFWGDTPLSYVIAILPGFCCIWLLDVIAPDRKTAGRVIANFKQVVKEGDLRLHPQIAGLVEKEMLEKMAASSSKQVP